MEEKKYKIKLTTINSEIIINNLVKGSVEAFEYAIKNNTYCEIIDNEKKSIYYPQNCLMIEIYN